MKTLREVGRQSTAEVSIGSEFGFVLVVEIADQLVPS